MRYFIFQKRNNRIESVEVSVEKIELHEIEIVHGSDKITLKTNFKIDSNIVFKGADITVIALYIHNGRLYPIGIDDIMLEEDDLMYLESFVKGKIYSDPKISAKLQKQEQAVAELRKLIEEKQILEKIADIAGKGRNKSETGSIDLFKL